MQLKAEAKSSEVVDEDETRQIFSVFDKDGDGLISAKEVHDTMKVGDHIPANTIHWANVDLTLGQRL